MILYIADAFTETVFGGNPAGVVILQDEEAFPSDRDMTRIAAELRYSETAFVKPLGENRFQTRYFTPVAEVDLCGHATIATFACLLDCGLAPDNRDYTNSTAAGDLRIRLQNGFIMMEMGAPQYLSKIQEPEALAELYAVMGIPVQQVITAQTCSQYARLLPAIISTGLPDIMLPVKDRAALAAIAPDFKALSALSEKYQVVGVHAFTLDRENSDVTAHCRNFAPLYDIDEEAATGTASGALTYYLYGHQLIPLEKESRFIQGEAMGRPSEILTHVKKENNAVTIQVGGSATIVAKGNLLPDF